MASQRDRVPALHRAHCAAAWPASHPVAEQLGGRVVDAERAHQMHFVQQARITFAHDRQRLAALREPNAALDHGIGFRGAGLCAAPSLCFRRTTARQASLWPPTTSATDPRCAPLPVAGAMKTRLREGQLVQRDGDVALDPARRRCRGPCGQHLPRRPHQHEIAGGQQATVMSQALFLETGFRVPVRSSSRRRARLAPVLPARRHSSPPRVGPPRRCRARSYAAGAGPSPSRQTPAPRPGATDRRGICAVPPGQR